MASIHITDHGKFRVYYRDPLGKQRSKSFTRKVDANRFAKEIDTDIARGQYVDHALGKITLGVYAQEWFAALSDLKPKTMESYRGHLQTWILPHFADVPVREVDPAMVRSFGKSIIDAGRSPATRNGAIAVLRIVLNYCVEKQAIQTNPALRLKLSHPKTHEMHFLTHEEVNRLAIAIQTTLLDTRRYERYDRTPDLGLLVLFAAYTGMRAGEIYALRVRNLDFTAGRVTVIDNLTEVSGILHAGSTKTNKVRLVDVPSFLLEKLKAHVEGRNPNDLVFPGAAGGHMRHTNYRALHFKPALKRAGLPPTVRVHDLRHTCAAWMMQDRCGAKEIMEQLGHSSIGVTFGTYGHLFKDWGVRVADGLQKQWEESQENGSD